MLVSPLVLKLILEMSGFKRLSMDLCFPNALERLFYLRARFSLKFSFFAL